LLVIALGYEIAIRIDNNLDKSNQMTREEIISLVKKDYNNYVLTTKSLSIFTKQTVKVFVKDNVVKKVAGDRCWEYINYNTGERLDMISHPVTYISSVKDFVEDEYSQKTQKHDITYYDLIDENKYDFEYLGEKDINGRNTIVIKITDLYHTKDYNKYYIDKETGLAVREIEKSNKEITRQTDIVVDYKYEFNTVKDSDIVKPDTTDYIINE